MEAFNNINNKVAQWTAVVLNTIDDVKYRVRELRRTNQAVDITVRTAQVMAGFSLANTAGMMIGIGLSYFSLASIGILIAGILLAELAFDLVFLAFS